VVATQNPLEHYGTYPLPESQMDRFLLRLRMGYPAPDDERRVIAERGGYDAIEGVTQAVSGEEVVSIQRMVDRVRVDDALLDYVLRMVRETRRSSFLSLGVSTRGGIAWYRASQALALISGRDYCLPDDFKQLAHACLAHRVVVSSPQESLGHTREEAERIISEVLERVSVPV